MHPERHPMDADVSYAARLADWAHGDQQYGDFPYVRHLCTVMIILTRTGAHDNLRAAAWLHDACEADCPNRLTPEDIARLVNPEVARLVAAVTDEDGANRKERKARTYPKTRAAGADAVRLKLADRIANVRSSKASNAGLFKMYTREHAEFHAALYLAGENEDLWEMLEKEME